MQVMPGALLTLVVTVQAPMQVMPGALLTWVLTVQAPMQVMPGALLLATDKGTNYSGPRAAIAWCPIANQTPDTNSSGPHAWCPIHC